MALPETRCPLRPGHLRFLLLILLASCLVFWVPSSCARMLTNPLRPCRPPPRNKEARETPAARDCTAGTARHSLFPGTRETAWGPARHTGDPALSKGWKRAPRETETRESAGRPRGPRPSQGPPARRPLPATQRLSQRASQPAEPRRRRRPRAQPEDEGNSPAPARALTAPEVASRPLPG